MSRVKLLLLLATAPHEVLNNILVHLAFWTFPAGTGGYQKDSQAAIEALKAEAQALLAADDY